MKSYRAAALLSFLFLFFSFSAAAQPKRLEKQGVGGSRFHKNDITYSTEIQTPHVAWAPKLAGGAIQSFFIPPVKYGRDMVELMQRISLAPTTVTIDREWDINCWGIGDYYGHEFRGDRDDFRTVYGYAEKDLTGDARFEVMLIPGLNGWSRMTRPTRDAILRRVREGAGLILLHPFEGDVKNHPFKGDEIAPDARIWEISPLVGVLNDTVNERGYPDINEDAVARGKWEIAQSHFITAGLPLALLPEGQIGGAFYKYRANGDVLIKSGDHPILAVKNYGKGRVVALAYLEEGLTPQSVNPTETKIYWDYWEYHYSLLARSLLWASGREIPINVSFVSADEKTLELNFSSNANRRVEIEVTAKSEFDLSAKSHKLEKAVVSGANKIEISLDNLKPAAGWFGGKQIFDVKLLDAKTKDTLDWATASFQVPKRARLTMANPPADVYRSGETLSAVVRATGELANLRMRLKIFDDLGRLVSIEEKPARAERTFLAPLQNFIGKNAFVVAELTNEKGAIVDQLRANPVVVAPEIRRRREYEPLVSFGGTKHYLQNAQMRQVRAAASDTGFTWSGTGVDNSLNIPRGTFGVYWYDRGPTTPEGIERAIAEYQKTGDFDALGYLTKKELYKRTGDKKFLRREPSFSDPAFMKNLENIVRTAARNKARYQMDYYFVGDEGSLTSYGDPVDFDWSAQSLADFREWLKTEYKTLDALNKEWKTDFKTWGAAVPYTTEEARKTGNFAAWADHRTFMETVFADAYRRVRKAVREGDAEGHIALSGTQATNAYNGADWYRLDQEIDDFLSYDGGNQWDLHRSFAKPHARIGFWTGYGSSGLAAQNAVWTAAIHNVLHPNVFWMYSFLNPDLTHSKSARDLGAAFGSLKYEGVGKLLMESERIGDGVAVHYSMPSVHAASILGYHQRSGDDGDSQAKADESELFNFPANRDGWVRAVKDLGLQFDFVSSEQIEKDRLKTGKYKILILPFSIAVSPAEAKVIEDFVRGGGTVIADAEAGRMNEHCSWQPKGFFDDLFGISSQTADKFSLKKMGGNVSVTNEGAKLKLDSELLAGIKTAETAVKLTRGQPLFRVGFADAAIINRVGGGTAVYLNSLFDQYSKGRGERSGEAYKTLLRALFERAAVRPMIQVLDQNGKPLSQAQTARYRFGESEVFAIVKDHVSGAGATGQDGVTIYADADLGAVQKQNITVKFPQKFHVTDIRSGKNLGLTDTVQTAVRFGDAVVFGLNKTPNKISVSGASEANLGEHIEFNIAAAAPGKSLVRCVLLAPDGSTIRHYQKNRLITDQTGKFVFPSAFNDSPGVYTIRVVDVVSGAIAEKKIKLK